MRTSGDVVGDLRRVTGAEQYVGDLPPADLFMGVVRSAVPHGRLVGVDLDRARQLDGVRAAWDARDLAEDLGECPRITARAVEDQTPYVDDLQPVLASDTVRCVGDPVAIVVAESAFVAADAVELVVPEIEPLPTVTRPGTEARELTVARDGFGDVEPEFRDAEIVVEADLELARQAGVPIEPRGGLARYDEARDRVELFGSAKVPYWNQGELARMLGIDRDRVRVVETAIGGSFGVRGELYPEDFLVCYAAQRLHTSVAWQETRSESLIATHQARGQVHRASLAGDRDGRIRAIRSEYWVDIGGYLVGCGLISTEHSAGTFAGPYDLDAYEAVAHAVMTNATPTAPMRCPGRTESTFVRERLVDLFAEQVGIDPIAVRRRNLLPTRSLQQPTGSQRGSTEPATYAELLDEVVATLDAEVARRAAAPEALVGTGVVCYFERLGVAPFEWASVAIEANGDVVVRSGATEEGQGLHTALALIAAETLGIDRSLVSVARADTDEIARGFGTFASRSTTMAGNAVHQACQSLAERLGGRGAGPWTREDLAGFAADGRIEVDATYHFDLPCDVFGAKGAAVSVDPGTGEIVVHQLVIAHELGRALDLELVHGQLTGGALQGLGGAVYEHAPTAADGTRYGLALSPVPDRRVMASYYLPRFAHLPQVDLIVDQRHQDDRHPFPIRGCGEAGVNGVAPAIAAAVGNALGDQQIVRSTPMLPEHIARTHSAK